MKKPDNNPPRELSAADKPTFDAFDDDAEEKAASPETYGHHAVPSTFGRWTGSWISVFALLFAGGLAGSYFFVSATRAQEDAVLAEQTQADIARVPVVEVVAAKRAPSAQPLELPGEIQAWFQTSIFARVSGYLAKWNVDIGDKVTAGQVLARIDTPELDSQLDAARADLKADEAEVKVKETDAEFARISYNRWRDSPKGVVSDQERESKKAASVASFAQLNAAQAKLATGQAKVDGLLALTKFKDVTAPFNGVIIKRLVDPGDLVTAGSTSSTKPLFVIEQADRVRVFASVPQAISSTLTVGTKVRVSTVEGAPRTLDAAITRMTGSLDPKARMMRIEIDLPNPDYALTPGSYVRAELQVSQTPGIQVPASALIFRAAGPQVAVVTKDNVIEFHDVTIVSDNGLLIGLGTGVAEGDRVALNINNQIANGDTVAVAAGSTVGAAGAAGAKSAAGAAGTTTSATIKTSIK